MSEDNSTTISAKFDKLFKEYNNIEETSLPTNDEGMQKRISDLILKFEETTMLVTKIGLFSSNESMEEISTSSLKFLLLPFLLGSLTLKKCLSCREEVLQIALIYFKDFIQRCHSYKITEAPPQFIEDEDKISEEKDTPKMNAQQDLKEMAKQRDQKIKRFREKKQLEEKVKSLRRVIENSSLCDEETLRDYYLSMLQQFCHVSLDELDSLVLETKMLKEMKVSKEEQKVLKGEPLKKPLRPFLLTRNEAQKKVFGAGYPSLPSMTVEEFYEQRVKEGWFPAGKMQNNSTSSAYNSKAEEEKDEDPEADPEKLAALRDRDEWRDTHRTGWGNTYNRS